MYVCLFYVCVSARRTCISLINGKSAPTYGIWSHITHCTIKSDKKITTTLQQINLHDRGTGPPGRKRARKWQFPATNFLSDNVVAGQAYHHEQSHKQHERIQYKRHIHQLHNNNLKKEKHIWTTSRKQSISGRTKSNVLCNRTIEMNETYAQAQLGTETGGTWSTRRGWGGTPR